ncbi:Arginyl-tRNA synthetase [Aphelenchoides fujianensis]|nr:Arginyl-tRNA synthetase [Aphelenchoides fujianensis]
MISEKPAEKWKRSQTDSLADFHRKKAAQLKQMDRQQDEKAEQLGRQQDQMLASGSGGRKKVHRTHEFQSETAQKKTPTNEKKISEKHVEVKTCGEAVLERLVIEFGKAVTKVGSLRISVHFPCFSNYPQAEGPVRLREATELETFDYRFDSCGTIAGRLVNAGVESPPTAEKVAAVLFAALSFLSTSFDLKLEEAHIDVSLKTSAVGVWVATAFKKKASLAAGRGRASGLQEVRMPKLVHRDVIVDFSSPNAVKPMHVGHLRSTIIGDSLARLLESFGYRVHRINHVRNWGLQFGIVIAALQDRFPDLARSTLPLADLQSFYKKSKKRFDEDAAFKKRAYECNEHLQKHELKYKTAWTMICDVSSADFQDIYRRLDVRIQERGESYYQQRMKDVVQRLEERKLLVKKDGCKLFIPDGAPLPLTVVKSDGGFTYDTTDVTVIHHRLVKKHAEWLLYVVDAGQSAHFESLFAAARHVGWYDEKKARVEHVKFGVVLGDDETKFKTISGDTVRLTDLLDESVRRAERKLKEKKPNKASPSFYFLSVFSSEELQRAEPVAYDCIRYALLKEEAESACVLSFNRMLDDRDNTAAYLLYAYADIQKAIHTARDKLEETNKYVDGLLDGALPLDHDAELKLAKQLLRLPDVLLAAVATLQLHKLCDYVHDVAVLYNDFHDNCPTVETQEGMAPVPRHHRLVLCEVTAMVMRKCFKILGIHELDKM